jgi:hypothetical protein
MDTIFPQESTNTCVAMKEPDLLPYLEAFRTEALLMGFNQRFTLH